MYIMHKTTYKSERRTIQTRIVSLRQVKKAKKKKIER